MFFWYFVVAFGARFNFHSCNFSIYTFLFVWFFALHHLFLLICSSLWYSVKYTFLYIVYFILILLFLFFQFEKDPTPMIILVSMHNTKTHFTVFADYVTFFWAEVLVAILTYTIKRTNVLWNWNIYYFTLFVCWDWKAVAAVSMLRTKTLLTTIAFKRKIILLFTANKVTVLSNILIFHNKL